MPASKPVADPARSTDPRDYQRVGRPLGVMAKTFPAGFVVAEHRHERAQLIHALSGVIELHVGRTLWLVPPQRAVWMPAGMAHAMLARGEVRLHTVYARPQSCPPEFPRVPRGVMVSPLLRELIVRAAGLPLLYDERGREGRLMAVLLDELEWSREQPLALPDPADRRLGRICQALLENPADPRGLEEWARYVGGVLADPGTAVSLRTGSDLRPLAPPGAPGRRPATPGGWRSGGADRRGSRLPDAQRIQCHVPTPDREHAEPLLRLVRFGVAFVRWRTAPTRQDSYAGPVSRRLPREASMQRLNVEFRSEGVALRGWLYLPEARAERPAIVMTHGFSGVKEQYLDRYAEVFAAAGFVVLLYDHPNFGDSDGEPRQEIDPVMQRRGYRDAITWLGAQARVDARRIGIWGTSYSGGHVLEVAALDRRVKCVVAQVPTVSGHASALRRTRAEQLPALLASFDADRQRRFEDLPPALLPAVAAGPDEPCAMAGADAHRFFTDSAALAPNWCNRVTLRSAELARENEPGIHMARISPTPLLMIVADRDLLTPTDLCLEAYQRALPPKRLLMLAGGHFTPYIEHFDATSQAAADWFVRHLGEGGEQPATVVE